MGFLSSLGSIFGFDDGSEAAYAAQQQQDIADTKQAGSIVQDAYTAYGTNRTMIADQFEGNVASARARMSASGFSMESGAWGGIYGGLIRGRDEALGKVAAEEEVFRGTTSYRLVKEDFQRMTGGGGSARGLAGLIGGGRGGPRGKDQWSSGWTGESFLTDKQKGNVLSAGQTGGRWGEYRASITPTWEEYEKFRFGSDEEKAAYSDSMDSRIEASNTKYTQQATMDGVQSAAGLSFLAGGRSVSLSKSLSKSDRFGGRSK